MLKNRFKLILLNFLLISIFIIPGFCIKIDLNRISELIFQKNYTACEDLINEYLKLNPDKKTKEELNFKLGLIYFQKGDYTESVRILDRCTDYRKVDAGYIIGRCEIYLQSLKKKDIFEVINLKPEPPSPNKSFSSIKLNIPDRVRLLVYTTNKKYLEIPAQTVLFLDDKFRNIKRASSFLFRAAGKKVRISSYGKFRQVKIQLPRNNFITIHNKKFNGDFRIISNGSKLLFIMETRIDEYVKGVVPAEMPGYWPAEALKSQAIATRSFTVHQILANVNNDYDLKTTYYSQVYGGANKQRSSTDSAVDATSNIIICYNKKPIVAYFHADSGGYTETTENVWSSSLPYLKSVRDKFSNSTVWSSELKESYIREKLRKKGYKTGKITSIQSARKSLSNRTTSFKITSSYGSLLIKGNTFRVIIGSQKNIKSLLIDKIYKQGNSFIFTGKGFGHGVGLPQWSARNMAEKGYTFTDILNKYYNDIKLYKASYLADH